MDGQLSLERCCLSLTPFKTPVATMGGAVYELQNIVPFVKRFHRDPVSGKALSGRDLFRLHFSRNERGKLHCPILYREFGPHVKVAAIRTTGNVFCWEALETLCFRKSNLLDLVSGDAFEMADVVILQDPSDPSLRSMSRFWHLESGGEDGGKKEGEEEVEVKVRSSSVRLDASSQRVLAEVQERRRAERTAMREREKMDEAKGEKKDRTEGDVYVLDRDFVSDTDGLGASRLLDRGLGRATTGQAAASVTSSASGVVTDNVLASPTLERARVLRWQRIRQRREKARVVLNLLISQAPATLDLVLHCDLVPQTCDNFLQLCRTHKYDNVVFHRVIKSFMAQTGDPTGTGRGGMSAFGKPFPDEIVPSLRHAGPGILSMANSGKDSNGSQFFITFKSAPHLDGKHTVFGHVDPKSGMDTLHRIEDVPTDPSDRPRATIKINSIKIFYDPFQQDKLERLHSKPPTSSSSSSSTSQTTYAPSLSSAPATVAAVGAAAIAAAKALIEPPAAKRRKKL